jgi:ADP-ribosylglycohydrolase
VTPGDRQRATQRARQSLEGLSVADAFGEQLLHLGSLAREYALTGRGDPGGAPWRWTDDTAMALSIVEMLAARGAIESEELAAAFVRRYLADPARGYGGGAREVLSAIGTGTPYPAAASRLFGGQGSCGNGGGMRAAPIGAYFSGDLDTTVAQARSSAAPTHAHAEGAAGAIAVAVAASAVFAGEREPRALLQTVHDRTPAGATRDGLRRAIPMLRAEAITVAAELGNGSHVLAADTVPFAIWCAATHLGDFRAALWACGEVGGDIDTTCAIVGGIVVGAVGVDGIPAAWRTAREPLPAS